MDEGAFPIRRLRRLRSTEGIRALVRESALRADHLIYPLFVVPGQGVRQPIASLPGQDHLSPDEAAAVAAGAFALGIRSFLIFGQPAHKDAEGSEAWNPDAPAQRAVALIKHRLPEAVVIADVCLCAYTTSGHCGVIRPGTESVDNDATLPLLGAAAVSFARAGADVVAPSDMMDGRVGAIRTALDQVGRKDTVILSYAAKFASQLYGPFREAEGSAPAFGDRRSYQLEPANRRQAMREVAQDLHEGADLIMVKPALAYLDVIAEVRSRFDAPLVAYNVSGEYAMVRAAAASGWADGVALALEVLTSIHRAGADAIITYHAPEVAPHLG